MRIGTNLEMCKLFKLSVVDFNVNEKILFILFALSLISIPFAAAHPFTEQTIPNVSSNAPVGTTEVIVYFS